MEYNSETPFSRKLSLQHELPPKPKWSTPEEFSALRQIEFSLKEDYSHIDAVLEPEPAGEALLESYHNQALRLQLDGREYLVAGDNYDLTSWPSPMSSDHPRRTWILQAIEGYWISAWHPSGYPTPLHSLGERDEALKHAIDWARHHHPELRVTPASAIQAVGSWLEGGAILSGISQTFALDLARKLGQSAVVEVAGGSLRVISVDESVPAEAEPLVIIELDASPCPMLLGCETERPCKRYGGPYGGRAISAAGYWFRQRAVAISRVGCSICEAGNTPFPHVELDMVVAEANASRYGTATRVDSVRVAQLNEKYSISPLEKGSDERA